MPSRTRLTLERVLGVTSLSNAMLAVNPVTGEIAYAAGCIVVIYNLRRNKQVRYYRVEKSVASLCFSPNGQYLAIGEKGYTPAITIWDGSNGTLCAELQMHKYGIACMAFSRDGTFLVSVGLVHDQQLVAWDLTRDVTTGHMKGKPVGVAIVEEKVLAMEYCHEGNFFVTVGDKHFKYWFLDTDNRFLTTGYEINNLPEIQGRTAVMAAKEDATFTSVGCGFGPTKLKTFAITSDGTLCSFGVSCVMERLVSLEAAHGNALSVSEAYIAVSGASSIVRLFDPTTLEYRATMPFPPAFGRATDLHQLQHDVHALQPDHPHRYPAVIGVRLTGSHLVALYSDRSLFIYDIADLQEIKIDRSFLFHSGGIRDMTIAGRLKGINARGKLVYRGMDPLQARKITSEATIPQGTFITCGDDNTIRFWHLDLHKTTKSSRFEHEGGPESTEDPSDEPWRNPFSQEMLDIIYHDAPSDFDDDEAIVLGATCSWNDLSDIHTPANDSGPVNGVRAVAIHPNWNSIVSGDKEGTVTLHSLPLAETVPSEIGTYGSDIQCVAFGEVGTKVFVAAGGRDRLIHVHDSSKDYAMICKLDNHSGAITSLHFTTDGKRLISCGADKNIVLSDVSPDGKIARSNSVPFTGGKIFDVAITSDDEYCVASCHNRLDVVSVSTGKHVRTLHVGEQHRIDICPANYCAAISGSVSDKTIHIVDLQSGETLADGTGHGESITAIKFTPDCRRVVSASSDGCIFVWRLAEELQVAIKARLRRVVDHAVPPPVPPVVVTDKDKTFAAPLMPPPAPPIVQDKKSMQPSKIVLAHADVRKADAKEEPSKNDGARGWKGKAKAVPGPLSQVPNEEWMRTRESAKPIMSVSDKASNNEPSEVLGSLVIDRSKTPSWARTFQGGVPTKQSPPIDQPKSKWAKRAEEPVRMDTTDHDQEDVAEGLTNLSLAGMDVSQSTLQTSTSLALEREQLEKRRKQEETAKAVNEMNERLSKLGLLKPQKDRFVTNPETEMIVPSKAQIDIVRKESNPTTPARHQEHKPDDQPSSDLSMDGIPLEMFDSIDLPISTLSKRQTEDTNRRPVMRTSIDLTVDQSMSTFTNGFAMETSTVPVASVDITNAMAVNQSLSAFSEGYKAPAPGNSTTRHPEHKGVPTAVETSQTIVMRGEVDASLSQFTEGFQTRPSVQQSVDISGVAASMSSFTTGYADTQTTTSSAVSQSIDTKAVGASLSSFTSGYVAPNDNIPVAQSLSAFTSGFAEAAKVNPMRSSSGYSIPETTEGHDSTPDVSVSLSSFTTGYTSHKASSKPVEEPVTLTSEAPRTLEKKASVLSSISDLDQQLQLTAQVLKVFASETDSNTAMDEIQSLMTQLGTAIQRFASPQ